MERHNFHNTSYGWNYFAEFASNGKVRFGRYHTNGHINTNEMKTDWVDVEKSGVDISALKGYSIAKNQGKLVTEALEFNANVECMRGVEMFAN